MDHRASLVPGSTRFWITVPLPSDKAHTRFGPHPVSIARGTCTPFGSHSPSLLSWVIGVLDHRSPLVPKHTRFWITVRLYCQGSHALWITRPLSTVISKLSAFWISCSLLPWITCTLDQSPSLLPEKISLLDHRSPSTAKGHPLFGSHSPSLLPEVISLLDHRSPFVPEHTFFDHSPSLLSGITHPLSTARDHTSPLYCSGSHIPSLLPEGIRLLDHTSLFVPDRTRFWITAPLLYTLQTAGHSQVPTTNPLPFLSTPPPFNRTTLLFQLYKIKILSLRSEVMRFLIKF